MRRLIVTADDLGSSPDRNEGILEAHERGIVTSASLLANGPAFDHAVRLARRWPRLEVGLHLNLSEGRPLSPSPRTLVDSAGNFPGKHEARRRAHACRMDPLEVQVETVAQLRKLMDAGLRVHHLDGHQHIHIFEGVREPIARAAASQGVRYVRCPADLLRRPPWLDPDRAAQIEEYRLQALQARPVYERAGLSSTDHFAGVALCGHLNVERLKTTLEGLSDGLTELMVHPGYDDGSGTFGGPDRLRELEALTDPDLKSQLQRAGVELTHFGRL